LVDEDIGVCAHSPRFDEPDVIEHIAALSAGRLTVEEIRDITERFVHSDAVVRLMPSRSASGWQSARWSTAAHRALEDETLDLLDRLQARPGSAIPTTVVSTGLGADQQHAAAVLCGEGGAVRAVLPRPATARRPWCTPPPVPPWPMGGRSWRWRRRPRRWPNCPRPAYRP
jgi:hypothetical protein